MNRARAKNNKCGFKGVMFSKQTGKWLARISINYKPIYIGSFETPEIASKAYNNYAINLHKEFSCKI